MGQRLELHAILEGILGSSNVYFQPPANVQMQYPCIRYQRDSARTEFGDNIPYRHKKSYQITVIDANPDSDIPDKVAALPLSRFQRHYAANNLNHDVFSVFF